MEEEKILIDKKTLKAISSETRMGILKHLSKRKYTLSELTSRLNLKSPTVKEHLNHLVNVGLVLREESNTKWKYYILTKKGKKLVNPTEIKILISFVIAVIATFGAIGYYIYYHLQILKYNTQTHNIATASNNLITTRTMESMPLAANTVTRTTEQVISVFPLNKEAILLIIIFLLLVLSFFLLIKIIKKKKKNIKKIID